ncbi:helix-turn-helix domain-containing protein [Sphingopyxis granuli]|uniref:helix-turn-helix domain-containing protein n=1 Tax=Sphingopyxis granuli TaxID=267128 RepID=UPI001FCF91FE|nr:helix-turn-helix transcriptional regulator [Sphingopyxis granuli]
MDNNLALSRLSVHIRTMFDTPLEIAEAIGGDIRARRLAFGWGQAEAADRAGVSYRTWRRMETEGKASIDDLVRAAIALRCEQNLRALFPEPAAASMDALIERQQKDPGNASRRRVRAPRRPT